MSFPLVQAIQMGLVYARTQDGAIIPELSTCGLANKLPYAFELSSVLFFLAPWTLIIVLYILIGLKLYKSKRDSSRTTCSAHCRHTACLSSTNTRATGRVVKMLGEFNSALIYYINIRLIFKNRLLSNNTRRLSLTLCKITRTGPNAFSSNLGVNNFSTNDNKVYYTFTYTGYILWLRTLWKRKYNYIFFSLCGYSFGAQTTYTSQKKKYY